MFRSLLLVALLATTLVLIATSNLFAQEGLPAATAPAAEAAPAAEGPAAPVYSYAIGMEIGKNFKADNVELDIESLIAGVKDALAATKPKYDEGACMKALEKLSEARAGAVVVQNKKFLEENKTAEGVTSLPSGLQYKVLKAGTGATPTAADTVRTHYKGQLIDGTVFDSSYDRGEPAEFPVGGVIKGWTEALQKMKVGDKWQLFIPSELAYGEAGAGGVIPPHATLIFEIELLDIPKQ
ncbi:MAG: FKBP-type peptidyl-prolyl cis-trans isomerase [Bythopirellula sp.]|nr:FKBP-type peptidyl-prolyl cis-trans isomerase [Bythopirellula sp.]